jgi:hypothetical protein
MLGLKAGGRMNAEEFVASWRREKDNLLAQFTDPASESAAARLLHRLPLNQDQRQLLAQGLDAVLTDTFYTLLMGLDGAASIGGVQESFQLVTGSGSAVAAPGELEASAWKHFHAP